MKAIARSLVVIFVALIAVPALAVTQTITIAVQLLATTALILGGTQHSLGPDQFGNFPDDQAYVNTYMGNAVTRFIVPAGQGPATKQVAVVYPAQFAPVTGTISYDDSVSNGRGNLGHCLDNVAGGCNANPTASDPIGPNDTFVIFGYSQSAVVASLVKQDLIDGTIPGGPQTADFFLLANPTRGNGGILARGFQGLTIPGIGITFTGPAPTNSCQTVGGKCYRTIDAAGQYDLLGGDAPAVPWNVLAWVNSGFAYGLNHGDLQNKSFDDPNVIHQGELGDTNYYMFTTDVLPMLQPLGTAGVPKPVLLVIDAPLRELVEWGYYRDVNPGTPLQFQLLPEKDPITLLVNVGQSIPVGIDNGLQEAGLGRLLGTDDAWRPFGVSGPAYDRTTGEPITPAAVTSGGQLNVAAASTADASAPQTIAPQDDDTDLTAKPKPDATKAANDEVQKPGTTEVATKPQGPFAKWRDSLNFDPTQRPSVLRPNGEGPLKKVFNALTGQRPKPAEKTETTGGGEQAAGSDSEKPAA